MSLVGKANYHGTTNSDRQLLAGPTNLKAPLLNLPVKGFEGILSHRNLHSQQARCESCRQHGSLEELEASRNMAPLVSYPFRHPTVKTRTWTK